MAHLSGYSPPPTTSSLLPVHVVAGALFDVHGRVLVAQRPPGKHMAGGWEFPGGKLNVGEDRLQGLRRELLEELGITVIDAQPLISYEHAYSDRAVFLDLWRVLSYDGSPQSLDGQALQWVRLSELDEVDLLAADRPMIAAVRSLTFV
jgi:8-oxo-dGTP diphosphatase